MVYHKKVYEAFDSKHQIDVDKSEWIVVRNMHEGIVTQEEFDMANANMQKSSRGKRGNPANKKKIFVPCLTWAEGNGRTQRIYIEQLCLNNGRFEIDFTDVSKEEMIAASVRSANASNDMLEELISSCLVENSFREECSALSVKIDLWIDDELTTD